MKDDFYMYDEDREKSLFNILTHIGVIDVKLCKAIGALGEATTHCSTILSNYVDHSYAGSQNLSGDDQLHLDIDCDNAVFQALRKSGVYSIAASEETPEETNVGENGCYSIGFDPLDGSSIIDANFSVGSIYGIWPSTSDNKKGLLNRTGREQVASAVAVYGPRTTLCIALAEQKKVFEVTLIGNRKRWEISRDDIKIKPDGKVFAPGNLRASNDNNKYHQLIQHWIGERYTLRYSGGMVPDVYHILAKGKGVFTNVSSEKAKAKLRLLYEVAPIGLIIECADGLTTCEGKDQSVLDEKIDDLDKRMGVCFGSANEVKKYKKFLFGSE